MQYKCPLFGFSQDGKCKVYSCLHNNYTEKYECSLLEPGITKNPILTLLSGKPDGEDLIQTSKQMLHLGLVLIFTITSYESDSQNSYCKCGLKKDHCAGKYLDTCESRKKWVDWLMSFYHPIIKDVDNMPVKEIANLMLKTLLLHKKTTALPRRLSEEVSTWKLNRRVL